MFARVATFAIDGLQPRAVCVEVDIRPGLPCFTVVGLGDAAVRESRERVRAAVLNSGFEFPMRRITANLAPAHLRKVGPGFDVALALGVLAASRQVPAEALDRCAVFGELSLDGALRGCRGTLAVAEGALSAGLRQIIVPRERAAEAGLVEGIAVAGVMCLRAVADLLEGGEAPPAPIPKDDRPSSESMPDLADVRGHGEPLRALEIAAAGGHNLLMEGPPGTGKTMLARRLPSILPPLSRPEAIEVTRIHSIAGVHAGDGLLRRRPFRSPHHTISASGLVGGGGVPAPGEATLAHHGVLFLDELTEFTRSSLEALRQPLEDGRVVVVRGQQTMIFPTRFMLVAATNPCPCGFAGAGDRCRCNDAELARHRRRLSGPLLDRIDLLVNVARPSAAELAGPAVSDSASMAERVREARERQAARLAGCGVRRNADMDTALVRRHVRLAAGANRALSQAYERGSLSARGHHRVLRLARTVADLHGHAHVETGDVIAALSMRQRVGEEVVAA